MTPTFATDQSSATNLVQARFPSFANDFEPNSREQNLALFRKLINETPESPLTAPYKRSDPALGIKNALLRFARNQAELTPDYFDTDGRQDGQGLMVSQALDCLVDVLRTKRFLQAIDDAVSHLSNTNDEIHVLDAGCGPFAIFGLFATLASEKVHCTCLDINPASAHFAKAITKAFGLEDRIEILTADATTFLPTKQEKFDLIISETMYSAFLGEPIVEILNHLSQFLAPNGLTLPSSIEYQVSYVNVEEPSLHDNKWIQYGCNDIRLKHKLDSQETLFTWRPGDPLSHINFSYAPPDQPKSKFHFYVGTKVNLGQHHLEGFDSNISWPVPIYSKGKVVSLTGDPNNKINIKYPVGSSENPIIKN